jgi:hypothetical protein
LSLLDDLQAALERSGLLVQVGSFLLKLLLAQMILPALIPDQGFDFVPQQPKPSTVFRTADTGTAAWKPPYPVSVFRLAFIVAHLDDPGVKAGDDFHKVSLVSHHLLDVLVHPRHLIVPHDWWLRSKGFAGQFRCNQASAEFSLQVANCLLFG